MSESQDARENSHGPVAGPSRLPVSASHHDIPTVGSSEAGASVSELVGE